MIASIFFSRTQNKIQTRGNKSRIRSNHLVFESFIYHDFYHIETYLEIVYIWLILLRTIDAIPLTYSYVYTMRVFHTSMHLRKVEKDKWFLLYLYRRTELYFDQAGTNGLHYFSYFFALLVLLVLLRTSLHFRRTEVRLFLLDLDGFIHDFKMKDNVINIYNRNLI
jgi:hypothetical protein